MSLGKYGDRLKYLREKLNSFCKNNCCKNLFLNGIEESYKVSDWCIDCQELFKKHDEMVGKSLEEFCTRTKDVLKKKWKERNEKFN